MDKIDQKILAELDRDPKISLTKLAKRNRISQQVADYRIKRLFEKNIVTKLSAVINLKALRQEHYRIFFTFSSKKEYVEERVFNFLKTREGVYWAARIGGKYDLLVTLFVYDFEAFDNFIEDFNQQFPGLIKDYKACYVLDYYFYKHKYLSKDYSSIHYGLHDSIIEIDELDFYILKQIKENCRLSSLDIVKGKNLSYKTIINRIKNLEKEKIILGYRMFISPQEKKPFILLLSFKEYSRMKEQQLVKALASYDSTTQILRLFGIWNLFMHLRIEDYEKLQNLVIELRDKYDIIDNFEIIPVFKDISINLLPLKEFVSKK